ncbi:hypothetical protein ACFL5V_12190 [Fibrobacterota bacterium]
MNFLKTIFLTFWLVCVPARAQGEYDRIGFSGFAGPDIRYTLMNGQWHGMLLGGRAGMLIHHAYAIGVAGYSLVNSIDADAPDDQDLSLSYAGLDLNWIIRPHEPVHGGFKLLVGGGYVSLKDRSVAGDYVNVIEPEWFFEGNVRRWLQIVLGFSYRFMYRQDRYVNDWDLNQLSIGMMAKFGWFKIAYD